MFLEANNAITNQTSIPSTNDTDLATPRKTALQSSWTQSLPQIPYEDVISAHSIKTLVPLILIRELLPLMGSSQSSSRHSPPSSTTFPQTHMINVSSREGIFESTPASPFKNGHHVHTNLVKAALNMLATTEAATAWVAMNSVDPGFMTAASEVERRWRERGGRKCQVNRILDHRIYYYDIREEILYVLYELRCEVTLLGLCNQALSVVMGGQGALGVGGFFVICYLPKLASKNLCGSCD
jgi:NAD(P)-dependent dehydrogenase (short-subunit alcohol dehydrogenase family)